MSYQPIDVTFDIWASPITIDNTDHIADLDDAVNDIITNDPQSLVVFINAQLAKLPPYLSTEMAKMYSEVEDSSLLAKAWATGTEPEGAGTYSSREFSEQSNTSAGQASTSAGEASTSAGQASTSAGEANTSAGEAQASETNALVSEGNAYVSAERAEGYLCANIPPVRECMIDGTLQVVNGVAVWVGTGCPTLDIEAIMTTDVAPTFESDGIVTVSPIAGTTNGFRITSSDTTIFKFLDTTRLEGIKIIDGSTLESVYKFCQNATNLLSFQWYGSMYVGINVADMCNGCSSMTILHIDSAIRSISASSVFRGCSSMVSFDNILFLGRTDEEGILMSSTFRDCTSLLTYNAPLSNWDSIQEVRIGGQELSGYVFNGCTALTYVDYLSQAGYNNQYTFSGCTALEKIRFLVLRADYIMNTLYGCSSLVCIGHIGISGDKANFFAGCTALTSPDSGEQATLTASNAYAVFTSPPTTCD